MATLAAIRTALADTITAGTTTELFTYNTVPALSQLPAVIIEPANADYVESFGGSMDAWWFNLFVVCSAADVETGQEQLDGFVAGAGPDSIRAILLANPALGLASTDATVMRMIGYGGTLEDAKMPLVGAVLKVRVYTDGA